MIFSLIKIQDRHKKSSKKVWKMSLCKGTLNMITWAAANIQNEWWGCSSTLAELNETFTAAAGLISESFPWQRRHRSSVHELKRPARPNSQSPKFPVLWNTLLAHCTIMLPRRVWTSLVIFEEWSLVRQFRKPWNDLKKIFENIIRSQRLWSLLQVWVKCSYILQERGLKSDMLIKRYCWMFNPRVLFLFRISIKLNPSFSNE